MGDFAAIFLGACLVNNLVLDTMVGLPPAVAVAKKIDTAIGMTLAMLLALTLATLLTYPLYYYLLLPHDLVYLQIPAFLLLITLGIKTAEAGLKKFKPAEHQRIAGFIPLTLIDSAALGVALLYTQTPHGLAGSLFFGFGAAAGFGLVTVAMAALQERLMPDEIPSPFRGIAILLITLGIMSMAFMGFSGMAGL